MKKSNIAKLIICMILAVTAVQTGAAQNTNGKKHVTEVTDATFNQSTQKGVVIIDFWATWCRPCLTQGPIFEETAAEMAKKGANFYKLDVDKNKQAASRYSVKSIPTIIIMKNGKEVKRLVGVQAKETLMAEIGKFL